MKRDTRNYGKFHARYAKGGSVINYDDEMKGDSESDREKYADGGLVAADDGSKDSATEKKLKQVAAGNKPWFETSAEGIQT